MATSVKLAKEFLIVYDNQNVARATDFDFEVNKTVVDISTLDSDGWRELLVDTKEWRISFNALVARLSPSGTTYSSGTTYDEGDYVTIIEDKYVYESQVSGNTGNDPYTDNGTNWLKVKYNYDGLLQDLKEHNTSVEVVLRSNTVNDKFEVGQGYITSLRVSGSVGDKAVYSGTIEGTADLETYTVTI